MIVTVTFDEARGETTLTIHTLFASVAMKNEYVGLGYAQGTSSGLDQLEEVVGANRPRVVVHTFFTLDRRTSSSRTSARTRAA